MRWAVLSGVLSFGMAASGCGGDDGRVDVYPVAGKIAQNGKPIEGAKVFFFRQGDEAPAAGVPIPEGKTDAEGRFELTTYEPGDGAPAGTYGVAVSWMEVVSPSDDPEQQEERDRLGGRYSDVAKSGLTATVKEDDNELPVFDLN
jgi:hypothetical protein